MQEVFCCMGWQVHELKPDAAQAVLYGKLLCL
jgi:hypothetical protein